jgi:hypothetical protein
MILNKPTYILEEMESRLNLTNACYHSFQNLLFSRLSFKKRAKVYITVTVPVVLYGCETWSQILRKEHRKRVFQDRVLRKIFMRQT